MIWRLVVLPILAPIAAALFVVVLFTRFSRKKED